MSEETNIEWADSTFNPWEGCTKVGPGCDHCYAETRNNRFNGGNWGPGAPRRRTSDANWQKPLKWHREADKFFAEHGRRRRVFCASLADLFDNEVYPPWRADLFRLIYETPNLDWLLLTKRIGNAAEMIDRAITSAHLKTYGSVPWPWNHVWLGATVVNQEEADRDIPKLLQTQAATRFISAEPLLGPINLNQLNPRDFAYELDALNPDANQGTFYESRWIDWVIAGGESGPGARPSHPDWFRSLRDQCRAAGTAFLFKQWGEWEVASDENGLKHGYFDSRVLYGDNKFTWVSIDASTTYPSAPQDQNCYMMARVGKKLAGRELDGETISEWPR